MNSLQFEARAPRDRLGLKGPRAAEWLTAQGIDLPPAANTWTRSAGRGAPDSNCGASHLNRGAPDSNRGASHLNRGAPDANRDAPDYSRGAPGPNRDVPGADRDARDSDRDAPDDILLVARLGTGEFFLEDGARGTALRGMASALELHSPGVYPVLREDTAFLLSGEGADEVLAQVCNVNFADLVLASQPLVMTLMIGVAVLVVPERADAGSDYRIWCDPTFGPYLGGAVGAVVVECGGNARGVTA